MSAFQRVQLKEIVRDVDTWNPLKAEADETFIYIDLSAVDQDSKRIVGAREISCGDAPSRARQLVEQDDVLVSTVRPNLNGVAIVPPELHQATASTGFCVIRSDQQKLDANYLFHWVKTEAFVSEMVKQATGASYPAVSEKIVLGSSISLPPLPEQRRIAAILDSADALRAKRREALAHLDSLAQSIFVEMFGDPVTNPLGWPTYPIGDISTFENGDRSSNYPSGDDIKSDGVLFLNTKNIKKNRIDLSTTAFISEGKFKSLTRGKARRNDIIITLRGTLGNCCIFRCAYEEAFINAQMMIIRAGKSILTDYLLAVLGCKQFQEMFERIGQGAAVPQLTSKQLAEIKVAVPPISLQHEFLKRIEAIGKMELHFQTAVRSADELFESLQHKAFLGRI